MVSVWLVARFTRRNRIVADNCWRRGPRACCALASKVNGFVVLLVVGLDRAARAIGPGAGHRPADLLSGFPSTVPIPEMVALWSWSEQFQLTRASGCGPPGLELGGDNVPPQLVADRDRNLLVSTNAHDGAGGTAVGRKARIRSARSFAKAACARPD